jgi:hypothetical protein
LKVKKKTKNKKTEKQQTDGARSERAKNRLKPVPLTEREHFKFRYRPRLIKVASIYLLLIIPLIFIVSLIAMYYATTSTHGNFVFWIGFILCLATALGWPMVIALYRLPEEKFACFCFMKYFLRLKEPYLVIASYSGYCPRCNNSKLNLIFNFPGSLIKRDSYFAKCHEKPEHTFPPDKLHLFIEQDKGLHK